MTQQSENMDYAARDAPPGVSVFLDLRYDVFRHHVLEAIDVRCVVPPLRASIEEIAALAARPPPAHGSDWPTSPRVVGMLSGLVVSICVLSLACGVAIGRRCRSPCNRTLNLTLTLTVTVTLTLHPNPYPYPYPYSYP